jgi:predicted DNA binding CopG/RHH family protein
MSTEKLPQTDSIQELAHFWDNHDLTDFEDQLEEVSDPIFVRDTVVHIELSSAEVEAVKQAAKAKGVTYTDLIKEWILEKVQLA